MDNLTIINKIIFFIGFLIASISSISQGLTAYERYNGDFVVFDHGVKKTLELQQIQRYSTGGKYIPYIDNIGYFNIYFNGKSNEIMYGPNIEFITSDNLLTYFFNDQLWVYDNGEKSLLTVWYESFKASDDIIAYLDNNTNKFMVYTSGVTHELEEVLTGVNDIDYQVGENIVAYNFQDQFKVFINGTSYEITFNNTPGSYKTGKNTIAYTDAQNESFHVFYKDQTYILEEFLPAWYKVADDMVVYEDQLGVLKIFYKGEVSVLSNLDATSIKLTDNICSFIEQGVFKVFINGNIKELEFFEPSLLIIENNVITYVDQQGQLIQYNGISKKILTSDLASNISANIDVFSYVNRIGRTKIYYQGEIY